MLGPDLNSLVNCDIVDSVSPPPDKTIFPQGLHTDWVKPGRAVWRYLDGGENTFDGMKEFSRLAGQLGFEYNVVEGFWQRWPESQMRELADYSRQQNVGLWFWKHSRDLRTPEARENFFSLLSRVGVVGAKIDFFDHEAKEIIDVYQALLSGSAQHKIMVEFHGANKPAGTSCTNATIPAAVAPPWPYAYTSIVIHTAHSAPLKAAKASSTRRRSRFRKTAPKTRRPLLVNAAAGARAPSS